MRRLDLSRRILMSNNNQRSGVKSKQSGASPPTGGRPAANRKFNERQAAKRQAALEFRRRRNQRLGFGSIVLVVVLVAVLVLVKVGGDGGGGGTTSSDVSPPAGTPIPAAVTSKLASIPLSTLGAAPTTGLVTSPQSISDPTLTVDGKPDLLFIGAEFCPVCATERWAMYVALSKFGTFSPQPGQIHSAVRDGDIPTLTFYETTYTSPYLTFTPVETTTNQPDGDYYVSLQTPTASQQKLWQSHTTGFPWLDFGGKMELTSAQYDPTTLEGQSFDSIEKAVGNNSTAIGADIDASAKVLVQTICSTLTGNKPANVCSAMGHG
jgi:hypothetical protein